MRADKVIQAALPLRVRYPKIWIGTQRERVADVGFQFSEPWLERNGLTPS